MSPFKVYNLPDDIMLLDVCLVWRAPDLTLFSAVNTLRLNRDAHHPIPPFHCIPYFVCCVPVVVQKRRSPLLFPLGPQSLPFIGCFHRVPFKCQWLTYEKWGRETGKLMHVCCQIGVGLIGH
jgi:hypothetical protein